MIIETETEGIAPRGVACVDEDHADEAAPLLHRRDLPCVDSPDMVDVDTLRDTL